MSNLDEVAEDIAFSEAQEIAVETYGRDFEQSCDESDALLKAMAKERLAEARGALAPMERAILDLVAIHGNSLSDIARRGHRNPDEVLAIFVAGSAKLAAYYEAAD